MLPYLQQGDLCIRDLGFTVLDVISKFIDNGIYFVARKRFAIRIFDAVTGTEIKLLRELRKKKFIDKEICIGAQQKIKVRLIALSIPPEQAQARRRKARMDRDKRLHHSSQYYELLGYSIYITNITTKQCNAQEIASLYKLRWQIEIIFKTWKSSICDESIPEGPAFNNTSIGEIFPTLASFEIWYFEVIFVIEERSLLVKMGLCMWLSSTTSASTRRPIRIGQASTRYGMSVKT